MATGWSTKGGITMATDSSTATTTVRRSSTRTSGTATSMEWAMHVNRTPDTFGPCAFSTLGRVLAFAALVPLACTGEPTGAPSGVATASDCADILARGVLVNASRAGGQGKPSAAVLESCALVVAFEDNSGSPRQFVEARNAIRGSRGSEKGEALR